MKVQMSPLIRDILDDVNILIVVCLVSLFIGFVAGGSIGMKAGEARAREAIEAESDR